ncbi:choice-of-anchor I family protein [Nocardioides gilvus]|uniref:choice-of-anchor I family protein n=1 Tax=Nocardioides gilvus TaxID=1735589 RepID=UPI000D74F6DF|nr:choice-of-anchor I family protein [Nocardioides gilvus]
MRRTAVGAGIAGLSVVASLFAGAATAGIVPQPVTDGPGPLTLKPLGSYETGVFEESAAEVVAWHARSKRILVVNAADAKVEVLDGSDPKKPRKLFDLQTTGVRAADGSVVPATAVANSVAVRADGLGAVAVEATPKTDRGWLVFFDARSRGAERGKALGAIRIGAQPDMVTITPDGRRAVVANEGEPAPDYSVDPRGSVSVVKLPKKVRAPRQRAARTAGFGAYEGKKLPKGVRVFGGREDAGTGTPKRTVSENLEPEYVAVDAASTKAYVTLQEANAIAVVDLERAKVERIFPLGTVNHRKVKLDASDRDGRINRRTWPIDAFRLPDAISTFEVGKRTYLITADEGDSRDWDGYSEEARVKDLGEDGLPPVCQSVARQAGMSVEELQADENLGRYKISLAQGLRADGKCYRKLRGFGGRGFSIWTPGGKLVSSSKGGFEATIARALPEAFNSDHAETAFDGRSDDKGPEPEGVTVGRIGKRTYAFIANERVGGVMIYDVSKPTRPKYVRYVNNRDVAHSGAEGLARAGDLGPEAITFVSRRESPIKRPLVIVGNEVSGTTTVYGVGRLR